jgi:hypothetical protein
MRLVKSRQSPNGLLPRTRGGRCPPGRMGVFEFTDSTYSNIQAPSPALRASSPPQCGGEGRCRMSRVESRQPPIGLLPRTRGGRCPPGRMGVFEFTDSKYSNIQSPSPVLRTSSPPQCGGEDRRRMRLVKSRQPPIGLLPRTRGGRCPPGRMGVCRM